jgi:hypothetical protein
MKYEETDVMDKNIVYRTFDGGVKIKFKYGTVVVLSVQAAKDLIRDLQTALEIE